MGWIFFPATVEEEAAPAVPPLTAGGEYGVVFLTERLFVLLEKDVKLLDDQLLPAGHPDSGRDRRHRRGYPAAERVGGAGRGLDIIFGGKDRMGV